MGDRDKRNVLVIRNSTHGVLKLPYHLKGESGERKNSTAEAETQKKRRVPYQQVAGYKPKFNVEDIIMSLNEKIERAERVRTFGKRKSSILNTAS